MNKFGLGKGLESLIPKKIEKAEPKIKGEVIEVEVDKISPNPNQPRRDFDKAGLSEMASSIKEHGIIQPLLVTKLGEDRFQLVVGERRLEAARLAGLTKVPVIVREASDVQKLQLAIIENIQRKDLNPIEKAEAYKRLIDDFDLNHQQIGEKVGKSRAAITNSLRLLTLPSEIQKAILDGKITEGHAKAILGLDKKEEQIALFKKVILHDLSVREVERGVSKVRGFIKKKKDPYILDLERKLEEVLGTRVEIKKKKKGGEINIDYYSDEELEGIIEKITKEEEI